MPSNPLLRTHPNKGRNVFLMMRFRDSAWNDRVHTTLVHELGRYGMTVLRADQKQYVPGLWANIQLYLDACAFGVAVFDKIEDDDINPNVSIELGYMLGQGKRILLLKEQTMGRLPSDLCGDLYAPFDKENITRTVRNQARRWLRDIDVAKGLGQRSVLFVSHGGTCRCAMAKVITTETYRDRSLPWELRIQSIAHHFGASRGASSGARASIAGHYGEDLLANHAVTARAPGLVEDADLVIVMNPKHKSEYPAAKTHVFGDFFGLGQRAVENPWPYRNASDSQKRYDRCFTTLREAIEADSRNDDPALIRALTASVC